MDVVPAALYEWDDVGIVPYRVTARRSVGADAHIRPWFFGTVCIASNSH